MVAPIARPDTTKNIAIFFFIRLKRRAFAEPMIGAGELPGFEFIRSDN